MKLRQLALASALCTVAATGARAASVVFARARETSVSFLRIVDPAPEDDFARA